MSRDLPIKDAFRMYESFDGYRRLQVLYDNRWHDIPEVQENEQKIEITKKEFIDAYYRWRKTNSWDYDYLAKELGFK